MLDESNLNSGVYDKLAELGNNESTRSKLVDILDEVNPPHVLYTEVTKRLTDDSGLQVLKKLISKQFPRENSENETTLFRLDSAASRMVGIYQIHIMQKHMDKEMREILAMIPDSPYDIRNLNPQEAQTAQNNLLANYQKMLTSVDSMTKSEKFPSTLKELNTFWTSSVEDKFPGKGEKFASQLFFLRFFSSTVTTGGAFKEKDVPHPQGGTQLGTLFLYAANGVISNNNWKFFENIVKDRTNPMNKQFATIVNNISPPPTKT